MIQVQALYEFHVALHEPVEESAEWTDVNDDWTNGREPKLYTCDELIETFSTFECFWHYKSLAFLREKCAGPDNVVRVKDCTYTITEVTDPQRLMDAWRWRWKRAMEMMPMHIREHAAREAP